MLAVGNTSGQTDYRCGYVLELAEEEELFTAVIVDVATAGTAGWIKT
jgi:hypothetical protein